MTMSTWDSVPTISDGDGVTAESVNKIVRALSNRTERLSDELRAATAGRMLVERDQPISPDVVQGTPVYWNSETARYEPALAAIEVAGHGTHGILGPSAYVAGVCLSKINTAAGDIITQGVTDTLRIADVIDGPALPGPYYLSTVEPGKLVRATPANGVYVLSMLGDGAIRVSPLPLDTITAHVHMRIKLAHGATIAVGANPGWSAAFDTAIAPVGARYLYVPDATERINLVTPMVPEAAAIAEINGALTDTGVLIDGSGIWWLASPMEPTEAAQVVINYTQSQVGTSQSVVTSLDSGSNVIKVSDPLGNPATRGPLRLQFTGFSSAGGTSPLPFAFKTIDQQGNMVGGPVVVDVKSDHPSFKFDIVEGVARLKSAAATDAALQGEPTIAVIRGGIQDTLQGIPYIGLPAGQLASVSYRFELPLLTEEAYNLGLELMLLGTATGTLPALTVAYSVVPSTEASGLLQNLTAGTRNLVLSQAAAVKGTYVRATLDALIPVTPGDMVFLTVTRNDASYTGVVGVMFAKYHISKV